MNKKMLQKIEEALKAKKKTLEARLGSFAQESEMGAGDWSAKMPLYNSDGNMETEADEVEEYGTRVALQKTLDDELRDVNLALLRIKKGQYGKCEKCQKTIPQERLLVYPQAKVCAKCQR